MNEQALEAAAKAICREQENSEDNWPAWQTEAELAIDAYHDAEVARLTAENAALKGSVNRWRSDAREFQDAYNRLRAEFDAAMEDRK